MNKPYFVGDTMTDIWVVNWIDFAYSLIYYLLTRMYVFNYLATIKNSLHCIGLALEQNNGQEKKMNGHKNV